MGCDIHLRVERLVGGKWVSVQRWKEEDGYVSIDRSDEYYDSRNYDLFAILANVRNGYGFAGCVTGEGFVPICEPKGLPGDLSPEVAKDAEKWEGDGHSHSWFTVAEIMAYDWTQRTGKQGYVNGPEYYEWTRWGRGEGKGPAKWCGMIAGPSIKHVEENVLSKGVDAIKEKHTSNEGIIQWDAFSKELEDSLGKTFAPVKWGVPYYLAVSEFLGETLPHLWRLGKHEEVRIVFWFDN